jgi:hypothetical protein
MVKRAGHQQGNLQPSPPDYTMKKSIVRVALIGSVVALMTLQGYADTTNKPAADKKAAGSAAATAEKPAKAGPFHGKLAAIDKAAKTITVGKRTFHVTSDTKIKKSGKPALLDDAVVGETVSGYVKPGTDGKLMATSLNLGPKTTPEPAEPPKPAKEKQPK